MTTTNTIAWARSLHALIIIICVCYIIALPSFMELILYVTLQKQKQKTKKLIQYSLHPQKIAIIAFREVKQSEL